MNLARIADALERIIFASRWLLAPFYLGLIGALGMALYHFGADFIHTLVDLPGMSDNDVVLAILRLIDLSLGANLLLIVIFAGYENFVSPMSGVAPEERASWMGKVDFSGMKLKLIGSIVAISAIHLLEVFLHINDVDKTDVGWMIAIHLVFIVSGVMLAAMDRLAAHTAAAAKH